jgi:hypothetical protein
VGIVVTVAHVIAAMLSSGIPIGKIHGVFKGKHILECLVMQLV